MALVLAEISTRAITWHRTVIRGSKVARVKRKRCNFLGDSYDREGG